MNISEIKQRLAKVKDLMTEKQLRLPAVEVRINYLDSFEAQLSIDYIDEETKYQNPILQNLPTANTESLEKALQTAEAWVGTIPSPEERQRTAATALLLRAIDACNEAGVATEVIYTNLLENHA
jgi:hypothetical protein